MLISFFDVLGSEGLLIEPVGVYTISLNAVREYWKFYNPNGIWLFPWAKKGTHLSTQSVEKFLTEPLKGLLKSTKK